MDECFDGLFHGQAEFLAFIEREPFAESRIVEHESDQHLATGEEKFHVLVGGGRVFAFELIDESRASQKTLLKLVVLEQVDHLVETPENQAKGEFTVNGQLKADMILQGTFPLSDNAEFPFLKEAEHLPSHAAKVWEQDRISSMRELFIFAHQLRAFGSLISPEM